MIYIGNVFTNLLEGFSMLYGSRSDSLHLVKHRMRDLGPMIYFYFNWKSLVNALRRLNHFQLLAPTPDLAVIWLLTMKLLGLFVGLLSFNTVELMYSYLTKVLSSSGSYFVKMNYHYHKNTVSDISRSIYNFSPISI